MAATFGGLSPNHEQLVRTYLKFVRAKRDIALKSMEGEFRDTKNDRLAEDMYSQEDVEDILDGLRSSVVTNLRQEVGAVANMSALLMKQLLEGAEDHGATLVFDTSTVEDQALLEEVERMRVDEAFRRNSGQASRLVSIKDEHARLVEETQKLQTKNETLEGRIARLQREFTVIERERDEERGEVEALRNKIRFRADGKRETPSKGEQGDKGSDDIDRALREIATLKEASETRLNEAPQFQQLKKLVASKSKQVVSLRRRLARYEPDDDDAKRNDDDEDLD